MQQQNERLRETLVKMRDFTAQEKHENQKLLKDLDQKKSEITELGRTKEKLSTRVEELELQIVDLQDQVSVTHNLGRIVDSIKVLPRKFIEAAPIIREIVFTHQGIQKMDSYSKSEFFWNEEIS